MNHRDRFLNDEVYRLAYGLAMIDTVSSATYELAGEVANAARSTYRLVDSFRQYNIGLAADQKVRQAAIRYNHGRARKVSFKRPSGQMSRAQLSQIKATALLEATLEAA